jgi:hypothetical protein
MRHKPLILVSILVAVAVLATIGLGSWAIRENLTRGAPGDAYARSHERFFHRAYVKRVCVKIPSLEDFEKQAQPFCVNCVGFLYTPIFRLGNVYKYLGR